MMGCADIVLALKKQQEEKEMISVTRIIEIESAHRLDGYDGKCANLHGHNWKIEVEVAFGANGRLIEDGPKAGMVMDFKDLDRVLNKIVKEKFDHVVINDHMDARPTAENMAWYIAAMLKDHLPIKGFAGIN